MNESFSTFTSLTEKYSALFTLPVDFDSSSQETTTQEALPENPPDIFSSISALLPPADERAPVVVPRWKLVLILIGLVLCIFCVAIDNTIVVTAIPAITDEYKVLSDVGWYGSAFVLSTASLVPLFGKIYTKTNAKWTFLFALSWFEIGSLICAVAKTSPVFIIGRAVAGAASAGLFSGALIIIGMLTPPKERPVFHSLIGGTYAVATIIAPLVGGAFTDVLGWRWCFYINLPIGAAGAALLLPKQLLHLPTPRQNNETWMEGFWSFDPVGQLFFIPSVVCILLALQSGGVTYPWHSIRIIALLCASAVLMLAFIATQVHMADQASIPPRIICHRNVLCVSLFGWLNFAQFFIFVYTLPLYFQVIKGDSARQSGVHTIPMILPNTLASVLSGILTAKYQREPLFFMLSAVCASIGNGLITTWTRDTPATNWIAMQVLGFGTGLSIALPQTAISDVLPAADLPLGISTTLFSQFFGAALFASVASNVLNTRLAANLSGLGISAMARAGMDIRESVPEELVRLVLDAYGEALRTVWWVGAGVSCVMVLPVLGMVRRGCVAGV